MKQDGTNKSSNKIHGNSHANKDLHHLYEIWDNQDGEVFKYGISKDPIGADGLSKRLRLQLNLYNLIAGFIRYIGRILIFNIDGKEKAERLEDEYIDTFVEQYGRMPKGNQKRNRKKEDEA